jgi:threonine/homoserine/homoserine lactone efflux protein
VGLLGTSAALVGNVSRYRFPVDPLLAVLAVGGAASLVWLARGTAQRRSDRRDVRPAEAPAVQSTAPDLMT